MFDIVNEELKIYDLTGTQGIMDVRDTWFPIRTEFQSPAHCTPTYGDQHWDDPGVAFIPSLLYTKGIKSYQPVSWGAGLGLWYEQGSIPICRWTQSKLYNKEIPGEKDDHFRASVIQELGQEIFYDNYYAWLEAVNPSTVVADPVIFRAGPDSIGSFAMAGMTFHTSTMELLNPFAFDDNYFDIGNSTHQGADYLMWDTAQKIYTDPFINSNGEILILDSAQYISELVAHTLRPSQIPSVWGDVFEKEAQYEGAVEYSVQRRGDSGIWNTVTDFAGDWHNAYFWHGIELGGNRTKTRVTGYSSDPGPGYANPDEYEFYWEYKNKTFGLSFRVHLFNPWEPGEKLNGQLTLEAITPNGTKVLTKDLSAMSKQEQYSSAGSNNIEIEFWLPVYETYRGVPYGDNLGDEPLITDSGIQMVHVIYEDGDRGAYSDRFYQFYIYPTMWLLEALQFWMNWGRWLWSLANFVMLVYSAISAARSAGAQGAKSLGDDVFRQFGPDDIEGYGGLYLSGKPMVEKLGMKAAISQVVKQGVSKFMAGLNAIKSIPLAWWNNFKSTSVIGKALMLSKLGLYSMPFWSPIIMNEFPATTPYLTVSNALNPYKLPFIA